MPCTCDGYDPAPNYQKDIKQLTEFHCSDRSLIMRMDQFAREEGIEWPKELVGRIKRAKDMLLKHKKEEHTKDIAKVQNSVAEIERKIRQIRNLEGEPTGKLLETLKAKQKKVSALRQMTNKEILGVD